MELLHHLNIALGQLMPNSWRIVIRLTEIWLIVLDEDMIRLDEFIHLYCLTKSKEFRYYKLLSWDKQASLVVYFPSSFRYWKSRYFFCFLWW